MTIFNNLTKFFPSEISIFEHLDQNFHKRPLAAIISKTDSKVDLVL